MTPLLRAEVMVPGCVSASSSSTSRPASASARATARPTTPAPMTTHSTLSAIYSIYMQFYRARRPVSPGETRYARSCGHLATTAQTGRAHMDRRRFCRRSWRRRVGCCPLLCTSGIAGVEPRLRNVPDPAIASGTASRRRVTVRTIRVLGRCSWRRTPAGGRLESCYATCSARRPVLVRGFRVVEVRVRCGRSEIARGR